MFIALLSFLGSQLLFTLIFSLIGLASVRNFQRALQRERIEQDAKDARLEGYLRFLASYRGIWQTNTHHATMALFLIPAGIGLVFPALSLIGLGTTALHSFQVLQIEQLLVLALIIGFVIGSSLPGLLRTLTVDLKAWHVFESDDSQPPPLSTQNIIAGLIRLLLLILDCEALAGVIILGGNLSLAMAPFGFVLVCVALLWNPLVAVRLERSLPLLEHTPWSALAPRVAAWARLAGVEIGAIRVRREVSGTVWSGVHVPLLKHPVLFLSETFLRYSEWRQQDAMIAYSICCAHLAQARHLLLRQLLGALVTFTAIALLPLLQTWVFPVAGIFTLVVLFIALVLLGTMTSMLLRLVPFEGYFTLDRMTAFLTGDPLALMVAMRLRDALNGQSIANRSSADPSTQKRKRNPLARPRTQIPSTEQRMLKLAEVMRQEWPRAPQAGEPVPAIITVYAGTHLITAPFDQTTSAAPVPACPYGRDDMFH